MKKILGALIVVVALVVAGATFIYQSKMSYRISQDMTFTVAEGEGFYAVIRKVRAKEPKISFKAARVYLKLNKLENSLKLGDYAFKQGASLEEIIQDFAVGRVVKYKVIIPEGYNLFEIATLLKDKEIVSSRDEFLKIARSEKIATEELGYAVKSFEGYLYPATYEFSKRTKAMLVIKSLVEVYKNNFSLLMKEVSLPKGFSEHELVILASVVEKETGASHERPLIASVFWNRLRKRMRLQSDPTTIYGQWVKTGERLFNIRKRHLLEKSDYNTYTTRALPVGPISNPGYEALKAVCEPAKSDYLYFVSKNDGTHYFSKTYKEHSAAVRRFQMSRKARQGKSWRDLKKTQ
ncbi:MAG: endolytic transglycosylase MltG [Bdellovibrionales bacterium]